MLTTHILTVFFTVLVVKSILFPLAASFLIFCDMTFRRS